MNDLISRAGVIDWYCKWECNSKYCGIPCREVEEMQGLPSAEPRWIPVTERLPEIDTDVLISYRYKEGEGDTSHAYIDITSYGDLYFGGNPVHSAIDGNRIKHWRAPFAYFDSNYEVTAWMPLPQPWKGADDEAD